MSLFGTERVLKREGQGVFRETDTALGVGGPIFGSFHTHHALTRHSHHRVSTQYRQGSIPDEKPEYNHGNHHSQPYFHSHSDPLPPPSLFFRLWSSAVTTSSQETVCRSRIIVHQNTGVRTSDVSPSSSFTWRGVVVVVVGWRSEWEWDQGGE